MKHLAWFCAGVIVGATVDRFWARFGPIYRDDDQAPATAPTTVDNAGDTR